MNTRKNHDNFSDFRNQQLSTAYPTLIQQLTKHSFIIQEDLSSLSKYLSYFSKIHHSPGRLLSCYSHEVLLYDPFQEW